MTICCLRTPQTAPTAGVCHHSLMLLSASSTLSFFFNDTATTEIYTLSLHDALPISIKRLASSPSRSRVPSRLRRPAPLARDRKSTRLNSSHLGISYAVFCLKKKNKKKQITLHMNSEQQEIKDSLTTK